MQDYKSLCLVVTVVSRWLTPRYTDTHRQHLTSLQHSTDVNEHSDDFCFTRLTFTYCGHHTAQHYRFAQVHYLILYLQKIRNYFVVSIFEFSFINPTQDYREQRLNHLPSKHTGNCNTLLNVQLQTESLGRFLVAQQHIKVHLVQQKRLYD